MTVSIQGTQNVERSVGMLGQFGSGRMVDRTGLWTIPTNDFDAFGHEWQVGVSDVSLFSDLRAPQWPQPCRMPDKAATTARRHLRATAENIELLAAARQACAVHQPDHLDLCVQDVLLTGDLDLADAW